MPSAPEPSGPRPDSRRPDSWWLDSWWQSAAIYQLYVRSFADGDGDGIGDLAGARARLPQLAELGIDAIWFNPWYPSPMADAGYDISDYRSIDPVFGTLADADALIAEAHAHGIRIIIDVVPNHGSDRHPWFTEALAAAPGSAARARFWFRPGRGAAGERPPNNWQSIFGGPAWTRVTEADGSPGEWYLHLFAPEQPDFNWDSADVRREFEDVLRFWFARGVDGIRIDSAALLCKDAALPDVTGEQPPGPAHPYTDRDEVHAVYQSWRAIADEFGDRESGDRDHRERMLIGEVWLPDAARLARYVGPGELHTVFNFPYLNCPWDAAELRRVIDETLALNAPLGVPATWVLSNHDVDRVVSRYGRPDTSFNLERRPYFHGLPVDVALGTRRARAAALHHGAARLRLHLPGRGNRPVGGPGHPRRAAPGPDLAEDGRCRPRPGRLPGAAALVRHRAAVRLLPARRGGRAVAAPAQGMARADRGGRVGARRLDAVAVPGGAAHPPVRPGVRGRAAELAAGAGRGARLRPGRRGKRRGEHDGHGALRRQPVGRAGRAAPAHVGAAGKRPA